MLWEHFYKKEVPYEARPAEAAASFNHVFIPELLEDGRVTLKALDIKTGKESWSYGDSASLKISPYVAGDKLYLPLEGGIHIVNQKSGKELDTIEHGSPVSSVAASNKVLIVADLGGGVTAYDLKSKKAKWSYENDGFEMINRPLITLLDNKVLLTEVKNGITVMLDASNGMELWSKNIGNPSFVNMYGVAITKPAVAENQVYYAMWDGQQKNGMAGYSTLLALDVETGNELWRYRENDFIEYSPILANDGMIVVTKDGVKAYQGGKNAQEPAQIEADEPQSDTVTNTEVVGLESFEGHWSTPGSDELAINISFTDDNSGVITYFNQGAETPISFKFVKSSDMQLMTMLGSEEKPLILTLYDSGVLGYKTNEQSYNLERSDVSQSEKESCLIDGFKGKWCDSNQELCFEVVIDEGNTSGHLDYFQDREPYQEKFRIPYMDEYEILIEMEAGASQISLS